MTPRPFAALAVAVLSACGHDAPPGPLAPPERALERTLHASLEAGDVERCVESLRHVAGRLDGDVVRVHVVRDGDARADLELRVPERSLDELRRSLRRVADVVAESEEASDVAPQRADLDARLRNARASEDRLRALAGTGSGVADLLSVEHELTATRERIERMDAERAALEERVVYAHATLDVSPRRAPFWRDPVAAIGSAFEGGVAVAASLAVGAGCVASAASPSVALLVSPVLALLAMRAGWRRRRRRVGG